MTDSQRSRRFQKPSCPESTVNGSGLTRRSVLRLGAAVGAFSLTGARFGQAQAQTLAEFFWPRGDGANPDHSPWSDLIKRYVIESADNLNLVRYRAFKADQPALKRYLETLARERPSGMDRANSAAYWVNLYNALTIDVILDYYPVSSIRDINLGGGGFFGRGPWSRPLIEVEGKALSLDNVEHDILRPTLGDARIHYVVNCASISCPSIPTVALTGGNLGRTLNSGAQQYVNSDRGVKVEHNRITASKIYDWYAGDFGGRRALKEHWLRFADDEKAAAIRSTNTIRFDYDWGLNDAG